METGSSAHFSILESCVILDSKMSVNEIVVNSDSVQRSRKIKGTTELNSE